jgi:hypothetical protein
MNKDLIYDAHMLAVDLIQKLKEENDALIGASFSEGRRDSKEHVQVPEEERRREEERRGTASKTLTASRCSRVL